ncbi:RIMS-binding protein 2-like isoform X4 [Puntigrus tetrazona]|uniref:RIMS-binding protein 2-like isoform X4 n=1 Tax=Puntigrus tetrazona TaxID=1606681 RepID=UPI001C8A3318|nr:RIMS-binding protein 2-like isoform X4 [Puntigrus tetrazona]
MMGVERQCEVEVLTPSQRDLQWVQKQLSIISNRTNGPGRTKDKKLRNEVFPLHLSPQHVEAYRLLEDRKHKLSPETAALYLLRQQHKLLETEISRKRKECEVLEEEVKKKSQSCQTLESELQHVLQEKARLNLRLFNDTQKAAKYEQVKSEYEQLQEALYTVTVERDCALLERTELQGKLENLEQVLKHMREAAERRQQLELEHEQALAVLSAKQQEIDLLQKAQVEAKKEHEGAVHLLENHLDSMQAKVRELEEKCRTQSEQFNLLSKELEKFRLQAGKLDILSSSQLTGGDSPGSPTKPLTLSQLLNGLTAPSGKGNEDSMSKISELIRPLQMTEGEKVELLSVKPTFLSRSTPSSPRRAFLSEVRPVIATAMDKELGSSPRSKSRYTGKVRLCVARYNYNPYDGPNEHPEAELPLVAGKYLYVYGTMDEDGFYEGELLDGQQGLVPSNFVDFVQDEELPSVPLLDRIKEPSYLNHSPASMPSSAVSTLSTLLSEKLDALGSGTGTGTSSSSGVSSLGMSMGLGMDFLGPCSNGTGTLDVNIDEIGEDIVPYPRRITLIKQLAKSVIISWDPPVVLPGWTPISGYNVLVDQEVRMSVPFGGRTKSLIEKLNLASCTHRISIQSVTERGLSDPLRCTLLVGKDVVVAPYYLRVENITQASAELTWMPSNSNYSHMIFLNEVEYDVVKPGGYKYHFYNLKPMTVYKIRVVARPHQMPWQLPLEQREKKEVSVEFCTQPAARHAFLQKQDGTSRLNCSSGPPLPPQDVQVQMGQTPGVLQIRWKPPPLTPTGTSNGANVIGYIVCTKGQKIAEIMYPTADFVTVELNRIQCLEAREVVVRTISAQGESQDSPVAAIPHNLLVSHGHPPHIQSHPQTHPPPYPQAYPPTHPQPHVQPHSVPPTHPHPPSSHPHGHPSPSPYPMSKPKLLPSARDPHAKEPEMGRRMGQPWDSHPRAPSPLPPPSHPGHTLEPPHVEGRRSPSPQRILPQPQGVPIPNTVARAMARQAAQRSAPNSRVERRNIFSERGNALHSLNSDEEEDGYDSPHARRRGASVDEFLRGSELGRHHHHYSHSEEYYTESSRGSDLSDIMEEDEEELYSEMQLEEGRRRSINSHNTLKAYYRRQDLAVDRDSWDLQREVVRQRSLRSHKRLHSIPEVAEEEPDTGVEVMGQRLRFEEARPGTPCRTPRPYHQDSRQPNHLSPSKSIRRLQRQRSSPRYSSIEERPPCWSSSSSRQTTKSPDSGLDCGSEEEGSLGYRGSYHSYMGGSPLRVGSGPNMRVIHSEGPVERRALAAGRKRTLTRQCSVEEDFLDAIPETRSMRESYHHYHYHPHHHHPQRRFRSEGRLSEVGRTYHRDIRAYSVARLNRAMDEPLILGSSPSTGRSDRLDHSGRRTSHGCPPAQRRPMTVPSIEITVENNSEGSEGNLSPIKDDVYYTNVAHHRKWPPQRTEHRYDGYGGRDRRSPDYYESEPEDLSRIFVAMFDYDPLSMSPNPDAAVEELPFKEGQIIKVFGEKDTDGFYRAEICGRRGLIPCNMVSEIQTDDDEMMDQLLKQGFLPLNTPIEKIVNCNRFKDGRSVNRRSRKSKRERNKRSGRQHPVSTRRMVALYDYDPRESSPNVDVEARYGGSLQSEEAELTFCAGDVITVFGEIDEDGFYYGELNGHKGLVPSNFLEEVPDDVEVYLTNTPSRHPQDHPSRTKNKRVPVEKAGPPRRSATPTVRPHIPGSGPAAQGPGSPIRRPRADSKKTGLLSKGKNLLKRLGAVK